MKIIGIMGHKGSGKTTAADCLVGWHSTSFAGQIRRMLAEGLGVHYEWLFDRKEEVCPQLGVTGRHALQTLGTEWGRNLIGKNVWVDAVMRTLNDSWDFVFHDVRFPNEAAAIRAKGGIIVRITRPGCDGDAHESEQQMKNIDPDLEYVNCGTEDDLRRFIVGVAENYDNIRRK